ncbi:unnamed protein product [Thelazia callipaeda]|uniref:THOC2_N domain-containing protein n=1 Tax=Thelazia callipaeda TaxID=103827 RepID=A0A0N5D8X6_THECL|nr:unnamed protein product [Thelazia callipaeda]
MALAKNNFSSKKINCSKKSVEANSLMKDDLDDAEELVFDFEAYPMCNADKEGLVNLLTQAFIIIFFASKIFLRADVDVIRMADILVEQSPFGCVYRVTSLLFDCEHLNFPLIPAEEFIDDDDEGVVYGLLSMLSLKENQKFVADIWSLLKTKAQKYAIDKKILSLLDNLSALNSTNSVGLLINERLLHFPTAIASPAFKSLADDLKNYGSQYSFSYVVLFLKIRVADNGNAKEFTNSDSSNESRKRKKLTKAQKKLIAANAIADADIVFDNREEELLFQCDLKFDYFQYPVQSDVEKDSKFNSIILKGVLFRPYRRVCFLENSTFRRYVEIVSSADFG